MSTTLKMPGQLLAIGQRLLDCGRDQEALEVLDKISHLAEVPASITVDSQLRLAEIYLRRRRFVEARRHLNVVLSSRPDHAQAHYLLAASFRQQEKPELRRAARHYRKAMALAPDEPAYAADLGLCLFDLDKCTSGLRYLREAVELAPDDVDYVRDLAMKLLDQGRVIEARRVALAALFRQSRNADLRKLWNEVRFHEARLQQFRPRIYQESDETEPALLPFRPAAATATATPLAPTLRLPAPALRSPRRLRPRETL